MKKLALALVALLAVMVAPTLSAATPESPVIKVTNDNYQTLTAQNALLVVDFWAPWCGPCRAIAPVIEELAQEYNGKVAVGKCNVDENRELTSQFGIRGIPAIFIIKNGKIVDQQVGYDQNVKEILKSKIEKWR